MAPLYLGGMPQQAPRPVQAALTEPNDSRLMALPQIGRSTGSLQAGRAAHAHLVAHRAPAPSSVPAAQSWAAAHEPLFDWPLTAGRSGARDA